MAETSTVLLSTHIMQEVEAMCQRVIIIDRGHIKADDNLEHLKRTASNNPSHENSLEEIFHRLTSDM
jgi:ABC-2 type transport system ATP-binding protein